MINMAFLDIEVVQSNMSIKSIGLKYQDIEIVTSSISQIKAILLQNKPSFIVGHNFIDFDKKFLNQTGLYAFMQQTDTIDTLYLSMLLLPNKITHKLKKPYKTNINIENDPLGDSKETKALFEYLDNKFDKLPFDLKAVFYYLLKDDKYFNGYFKYKKETYKKIELYDLVKAKIVCSKKVFEKLLSKYRVETAFALSYVLQDFKSSISYVLLKKFPNIVRVLEKLTFDAEKIDIDSFARDEFGIDSFRVFENDRTNLFNPKSTISQKEIIVAALKGKSLLGILPTGGGKTFTFQLPALVKAKAYKSLSVVISPLQALMKNHIDGFKEKNQNFSVIAISGFLSPIERMDALEKVRNGEADILYLAPEALRSNSIFNALKKRIIDRFIIDEAHCFSSWGHDFRHDYHFIAHTIKELEDENEFQPKISVSCFSATAKPEVLKDIKDYFLRHLGIKLDEFIASSKRYNLEYSVVKVDDKKQKYEKLVEILKEHKQKATIIYIPHNARECRELCDKLQADPRITSLDTVIEPFYAKLDNDIESGKRSGRKKSEILNDFIANKVNVVIATTAFGMGIDKPDIELVVHYEQSDSLESYLQESGRGARDQNIRAKCIVLFCKNDFNRIFAQLNLSKVEYSEIARVVREIKKSKNETVYLSVKELAKRIGLDTEDSKIDYDSMIKTALLELEQADIIERGRNSYAIFATSIDKEKRDMQYIREVLEPKQQQYEKIYQQMIQVMQNIIQRSKVDAIEVDDLSEMTGIKRDTVFDVLYSLQKEKLIDFKNDISIYVKKSIMKDFGKYIEVEKMLFDNVLEHFKEHCINLRELNSYVDVDKNNITLFKNIIKSWGYLFKLRNLKVTIYFKKDIVFFDLSDEEIKDLGGMIKKRQNVCNFILTEVLKLLGDKKEAEIEVSSYKLKESYDAISKISLLGFHHSIVYLQEILKQSFQLRKGRLIYYQAIKITKKDRIYLRMPYGKREHYNKTLKKYYQRKIEAIHIFIKFLEKIIKEGLQQALKFVQDYFSLEYKRFKKRYNLDQKELSIPLTKEKFEEILGDLNSEQKAIFDDKKSDLIMVLAGPGSGKTKTLAHKIASLITVENHKVDYFLMLAHSRTAVNEFRYRLKKLVGEMANSMKIMTFHSFAIELLGRKVDESLNINEVIQKATTLLEKNEINIPFMEMLVLDEYQDIAEDTYNFIKAIYKQLSKDKKIIAVGDDDQCINNFGKNRADIKYIKSFKNDFYIEDEKSIYKEYELITNYRSSNKIVKLSNKFTTFFKERLKRRDLVCFDDKKESKTMLFRYLNANYQNDIIKKVAADTSNDIAILARNNDEVLSIYSKLIISGVNTKYIISKEGFGLGNIVELTEFCDSLESMDFEKSLAKFSDKFQKSKNFELAKSVIDKFYDEVADETIKDNHRYLASIFREYISEITFEEFEQTKTKVMVSTMHKAKGKEFESVYVAIDDDFIINEYEKRLLYVALTRAKNYLYIYSKISIFDRLEKYFDTVERVSKSDLKSDIVVFQMGLHDINLSNDFSQKGIEKTHPIAGDKATIKLGKYGYQIIFRGYQIAQLSKVTNDKQERVSYKIEKKIKEGYTLQKEVEIEYIVRYFDKNLKKYFLEPLCKIYLKRFSGRERGIRTPGGVTLTGFQD